MSWALHRVDDRLIHGHVVIAWGHRLNPRRIWVVDDASAANEWERELLSTAAPGVEVRVLTVQEAASRYADEASSSGTCDSGPSSGSWSDSSRSVMGRA